MTNVLTLIIFQYWFCDETFAVFPKDNFSVGGPTVGRWKLEDVSIGVIKSFKFQVNCMYVN